MGAIDQLIRILTAITIAVLYYLGKIDGTLAIILMAVAVILILTSLVSFCPIYNIFGINSCKRKAE